MVIALIGYAYYSMTHDFNIWLTIIIGVFIVINGSAFGLTKGGERG